MNESISMGDIRGTHVHDFRQKKRKEKERKDKPEIYWYLLPPTSKDCQDISLLLSSLLLSYSLTRLLAYSLHGIKKTLPSKEIQG